MRYLIPEFTGLGDIIQKTPMIKTIRELDPGAQVFLIGDNRWGGLDVIKDSPLIDDSCNVIKLVGLELPRKYDNQDLINLYRKLNRKQLNLIRDWINSKEWEAFFQNHQGDIPQELSQLIEESGNGKVFKHVEIENGIKNERTRLFRKRETVVDAVAVPVLKGRHDIDANYDLLEYCQNRPIARSYDTWTSLGANQKYLKNWNLKKNNYICFQPGAANGSPTPKTWSARNFVDLSRRLINEHGKTVVLLGDAGDQDHIISRWNWPSGIVNTAGKTSLGELASLIGNASCVVVHDSGIMHLANAMDIPLVALYGPTDYTATRPLGKKSTILFSKTAAFATMYSSGLSEKTLAEEYPNNSAMEAITVAQVENAVTNSLSKFN